MDEIKKKEHAPWPPISNYGDGVSRTDGRTWKSAEEIQRTLTEHHESSVMTILREQTEFCSMETKRLQALKEKCLLALRDNPVLADEVSSSFDETTKLVMTWAAIFQEIFDKEDETYERMVKLCQRFWTRCPEYGYPTDNSLLGSVYAPLPFIAEAWRHNVKESISTTAGKKKNKKNRKKKKKKKSPIKKEVRSDEQLITIKKEPEEEKQEGKFNEDLTSQDILRIMEETLGDNSYNGDTFSTSGIQRQTVKPPVCLVTTNANKREQKISKQCQASLTHWPDFS